MKLPALALEVIKRFEGIHKVRPDGMVQAYKCPADVPTIGWGSTGPDVTMATLWTKAQCDARLERDAQRFADGVTRASPTIQGDEARTSALTSFAYNLGLGNYQSSTLRRRVNERDWPEAGRQIRRWNRAAGRVLPGLVLRRELEAALLEGGDR